MARAEVRFDHVPHLASVSGVWVSGVEVCVRGGLVMDSWLGIRVRLARFGTLLSSSRRASWPATQTAHESA
jgi:hypothetical protein